MPSPLLSYMGLALHQELHKQHGLRHSACPAAASTGNVDCHVKAWGAVVAEGCSWQQAAAGDAAASVSSVVPGLHLAIPVAQ